MFRVTLSKRLMKWDVIWCCRARRSPRICRSCCGVTARRKNHSQISALRARRLAREVEVHVLTRTDCNPVYRRGSEAPILQGCNYLVINVRLQRLNDLGLGYDSVLIDGDFHDHIALQSFG